MTSKKNTQFLILQSIGIILVVLGHKGGINLFTEWFPIYSFHMPLFIFISGYFYKASNSKNLKLFILNKAKRLLVPYFVWNLIYGIIFTSLTKMNVIDYSGHGARMLTLKTLFIDPWVDGHQFIFNLATWFVLTLFLVQLVYVLFRRACSYINFSNEYFIMTFFIIIGAISTFLANSGNIYGYKFTIIKVLFLIPFFQMGYLYKQKLESRDNLNNILYFIVLFSIQFLLIKKYIDLSFSVAWLNVFNKENILLPYISSVTGILFWLRISKILLKSFEGNKVVEFIGSHTWDIMTHHIFVFFILNLCILILSPVLELSGFNYELFKTDVWYTYMPINSPNITLFYSIAGVSVPLIIRYSFEKFKVYLKSKKNNKQEIIIS